MDRRAKRPRQRYAGRGALTATTTAQSPATIFIVNRFYYPDHSATAQIASDLGASLAQHGWQVRAVASRFRYEGGEALPAREQADGVTIRRLATTGFGRTSRLGRLIDYASFYVLALGHVARHARRGDIVICKTDPPLLSVGIALACVLRGAKLINWLQDLFPEVAAEILPRPVAGGLRWLRNHSLRRASLNVAIGEVMRTRLKQMGVGSDHVTVIANWTDDEDIAPIAAGDNALRRQWGYGEDDLVMAYSGNLGFAHDYTTVLDAAEQLAEHPNIRFLMIGGGAGVVPLKHEVGRRALPHFQFRPYQPRGDLSLSLGVADIHWLSLRPEMEGLIVPSKLYGIVAAGRPFVFIGDREGEVGQFIARHGGGFVIEQGDGAALAGLLRQLASDRRSLATASAQALAASGNYRRSAALNQWRTLLSAVSAQSG